MRVSIVLVVLAAAVSVCAAPPGIILDTDLRSDVDEDIALRIKAE